MKHLVNLGIAWSPQISRVIVLSMAREDDQLGRWVSAEWAPKVRWIQLLVPAFVLPVSSSVFGSQGPTNFEGLVSITPLFAPIKMDTGPNWL